MGGLAGLLELPLALALATPPPLRLGSLNKGIELKGRPSPLFFTSCCFVTVVVVARLVGVAMGPCDVRRVPTADVDGGVIVVAATVDDNRLLFCAGLRGLLPLPFSSPSSSSSTFVDVRFDRVKGGMAPDSRVWVWAARL
jgi:hypothetical protein